MSYFTAVLATDAWGWRARDVSVEEADDLPDLADRLRAVAVADAPVLAIVEREDDWFALVRVDGEEDPRLFVSNYEAAMRGPFAAILGPAADLEDTAHLDARRSGDAPAAPRAADGDGSAGRPEDETAADVAEVAVEGDDEQPAPAGVPDWAGDPELLDDLGFSGDRMRALAEENEDDPAGAIAEIGEEVGFFDLVEALR